MQFTAPVYEGDVGASPQTKERPHMVYWFAKDNGEVFCAQENEAWTIMKGRIQNSRKGRIIHKYLGATDSKTYFDGLPKMHEIMNTQGIEAAQEYLRELYKKEADSADPSIKPSNTDVQGDGRSYFRGL